VLDKALSDDAERAGDERVLHFRAPYTLSRPFSG
jgi:hypothetical protein